MPGEGLLPSRPTSREWVGGHGSVIRKIEVAGRLRGRPGPSFDHPGKMHLNQRRGWALTLRRPRNMGRAVRLRVVSEQVSRCVTGTGIGDGRAGP
ncbi:hypothetical protein GCM10010532_009000 [Dactylosporangium siamense]|uniref:Uncharacterized protein n=1 Tax=Dactylosporangium siamense TaxID=685454 RepID=A0A919PFR0_9ACTN|nr:hypothetical protein Dsi01nite_008100 [Dactylosporangium siamense]